MDQMGQMQPMPMQPGGPGGQPQPQMINPNQQQQPFQVDPGRAFHKLQQRYADEMARAVGDLAAKDAAIDQIAEENQILRQQVDMLSRRLEEMNQAAVEMAPSNMPSNIPPNPQKEAGFIDVNPIAAGNGNGGGNGPIPSIPTGEHVPHPSIVQGPPPGSPPGSPDPGAS